MTKANVFLVLGLLQAMVRTRSVMQGTKWIFLCSSPNSPVAAKLAEEGVRAVKSLSVRQTAPAFYQYSRCLHLASTTVSYFQDSRRRPSVGVCSAALAADVEQKIGAVPAPTKRATAVAGAGDASYTIFKFGQSIDAVYHIRVLRSEADRADAADLRVRMSRLTGAAAPASSPKAGEPVSPPGSSVLDQYESTAVHLGFYKEVRRNVLGRLAGTARVHADLAKSPAPYAAPRRTRLLR